MFGWFRKKAEPPAADVQPTRFMVHFAAADGTVIQRGAIAAAMSSLEVDAVQKERLTLSPKDQATFMMTYACMVVWAITRGMVTRLKSEEVDAAIVAMQFHFAKHAWYQPEPFAKLW
jgi:tryptophan synthase alpha subunit